VDVSPDRFNNRSDRQFPKQRKSWADIQGIKTGVIGETIDGVLISEANRATVFEFYREGIETLRRMARDNYLRKGVKAVLVGTPTGNPAFSHKYAVYVISGFLRNVTEDETLVPRQRPRQQRNRYYRGAQ
jgi:hypothetical protein